MPTTHTIKKEAPVAKAPRAKKAGEVELPKLRIRIRAYDQGIHLGMKGSGIFRLGEQN